MRDLRVAVIGIGAMGRIHAEHLATSVPGASLAAIADINVAAARDLATALGVQAVYQDYRELLADTGVDAVVIATPRQYHAPAIIEAAALGKHVFCEKPIAGNAGEAIAAIEACEKAGIVLQIGFHRRFDASFANVHERVMAGDIGRAQIIHMISRDPITPETRAGRSPEDLVLETTIHDLDMARYLAGSEIGSLHAIAIPTAEPGVIDGVVVMLEMANGVIATIDNHIRSTFGYDQRLEVFGSGGMVAIENETPHLATLSTEAGVIGALPVHFFAERYDAAYTAELRAFVQAIADDGSPPQVAGTDGLAAVVGATAVLDSLRTGGPVKISG